MGEGDFFAARVVTREGMFTANLHESTRIGANLFGFGVARGEGIFGTRNPRKDAKTAKEKRGSFRTRKARKGAELQ